MQAEPQAMRPVVLASLLLLGSALSGGAAEGAAPPLCHLVMDPSGDEALAPGRLPSLDITSADIASDARTVTGVVRLKSYDVPNGGGSRGYVVVFTVPYSHKTVFVIAWEKVPTETSPFGYQWGLTDESTGTPSDYLSRGEVTGAFDSAKAEIHISVPISELAKFGVVVKSKIPLTNIHASTWPIHSTLISATDVASTPRSYRAGTPSCVKPGT